jgi:hypothetical protein
MTDEIPAYVLRAYALLFTKYGTRQQFGQSCLDWIVGTSMKKKIFAALVRAGWIRKKNRTTYQCVSPAHAVEGLLAFKVSAVMKQATKPYMFTGLSAVEIWSDYVYVQRGIEKSPYFIKVLEGDIPWWNNFFNKHSIPHYINKGTTIGEYVIIVPVKRITKTVKDGICVEPLRKTMAIAKQNSMYAYAYDYMRDKYGTAAT